ncbi:competence/damage-inducible protein A [Marinivivus vitaminiproducens]|uniref:competence/damage-inducible protein A n=1 Tax=Marinivivus vitaminiproducens TaxID=3035935 RepID=UPI0027A0A294|nr:molybdopterin-binding protein [Geminicoccaceae bacterium SCSIO 64248]
MTAAVVQPTAALLIIGDEILSGRTQDANLAHIAKTLGAAGIAMREARVVPDVEARIVEALNALRAAYTYVFTTGGIGPTHDDITAASVAKAFGRPFGRNPEAERRLVAYYNDSPNDLNAMRLRMADMPADVDALIDNPASAAPGFVIGNVYVLPGVPRIMQAMLDGVVAKLEGGPRTLSRTVTVFTGEGEIAADLAAIQTDHPDLSIGSYPFMRHSRYGTSIVFRGIDQAGIDRAAEALLAVTRRMGVETSEDVGAS